MTEGIAAALIRERHLSRPCGACGTPAGEPCRDGWLTGDPLLPAEPRDIAGWHARHPWQLWRHGLRASELRGSYRWRWAARVALALAPFDGHVQRSDEPQPSAITTPR